MPHLLVFITDLTIVSASSGRIVRRLMTSQLMPYLDWSSAAASRQSPTGFECATSVMSVPARVGSSVKAGPVRMQRCIKRYKGR